MTQKTAALLKCWNFQSQLVSCGFKGKSMVSVINGWLASPSDKGRVIHWIHAARVYRTEPLLNMKDLLIAHRN